MTALAHCVAGHWVRLSDVLVGCLRGWAFRRHEHSFCHALIGPSTPVWLHYRCVVHPSSESWLLRPPGFLLLCRRGAALGEVEHQGNIANLPAAACTRHWVASAREHRLRACQCAYCVGEPIRAGIAQSVAAFGLSVRVAGLSADQLRLYNM